MKKAILVIWFLLSGCTHTLSINEKNLTYSGIEVSLSELEEKKGPVISAKGNQVMVFSNRCDCQKLCSGLIWKNLVGKRWVSS